MGIRGRVLFATALVAVVAMAIMAWIVPQRLLDTFDAFDTERVHDDAASLTAGVRRATSHLESLAATAGRTPDMRSLLVEGGAFPPGPDLDLLRQTLEADGVAILDADGELRLAFPEAFGGVVLAIERDIEPRSGAVTTSRGQTWLVAEGPVTGPVATVPAVGTIAWGRLLDEAHLADLGPNTESPPRLVRGAAFDEPRATADGFTLAVALPSLDGEAMALEVTRARLARGSGGVWAQWLRWTQLLVGIVAASGFFLWIDRHFVRRVARLRRDVDRVGADARGHVTVDGVDEVAAVGAAINEMLDRVASTQAELEQRNEELDEANRATDRFVAMISHELRTPLTAILGFASTLQDRWEDLPHQQRGPMLERIRVHARILDGLVADLLAMQAAQAAPVGASWTPLDAAVARIVSDLPDLLLGGVVTHLGAPDVEVGVGQEPLRRVITNLVTNAVKYGAPPVTISTRAVDGVARIEVQDRGTGVPEDFVDQLFEPFSQAASDARRPGVGLGLSIVAEIIASAGGQISYRSRDGGGAAFRVEVGTRPTTARAAPPDPRAAARTN